jgi:hypothetical protein
MTQNFDWMVRENLYEPSAVRTIEPAHPSPTPFGWNLYLIGAVIFILCCGLAAGFEW